MSIPPPPPPPQERFAVLGRDGQNYLADLTVLREWVSSGRVTRDDQVFSYRTQQWTTAGQLPMLRDLFPSTPVRAKTFPVGCMVTAAVMFALFLIVAVIEEFSKFGEGSRTSPQTETRAQTSPGPSSPTRSLEATETPAQRRVEAAADLQRIFDASDFKGWELKFVARGRRCDALHIQGDVNLHPEMMEAIGYGTVAYGEVLPGGVNKRAFDSGFRDVIYTNPSNAKWKGFGESHLTRDQILHAPACTPQTAASVDPRQEKPVTRPAEPRFEQLSWDNARVGLRLYDGAYRHDVTIVSLDRANDMMEVKYVKSGRIEPKRLSAVATFWYVKAD